MADSFELAPRPGQTTSQRKAELDSARFVAVRNLAYMIYKKPNSNEPLMTYQETLEDREAVKLAIINHELAIGSLVNDGVASAPAAQPMAAGPQMMAPAYASPQQMAMTPATPAQAAQAAAPTAQPAPAAVQSTGRPRRGARPAEAAPPNGATQQSPQMPAVTPVAQQAAAPSFMGVAGAQQTTPLIQAPPQATQAVSQDLSEVIARLDRIGQGLSQVSKDIDALTQRVVLSEAVLGKVNVNTLQAFAALHHIYSVQGQLAQALQQERVGTLDQFRAYLTPKYTGNP